MANFIYDYDALTTRLDTFLDHYGGGADFPSICDELEVDPQIARRVLKMLRSQLSEDNITVPVVYDGGAYLYVKTSDVDEAHDWLVARYRAAVSNQRTTTESVGALMRAADPASADYAILRRMHRQSVRMEEDLADYLEEGNL